MGRSRSKFILISFAVIVFTLLALQPAAAQFTPGQIRSSLVQYADFSEADLTAMDKGEIVVKPVKTANKQDVSVIGVVKNPSLPAFTMTSFRDTLTQKSNKEIGAKGRFALPPVLSDLDSFQLENRDFDELRKCKIGNCDVNMSAEWIRRVNSEIDWNAHDHKERATGLIRSMLMDYASRYWAEGNGSLGTLVNRKKAIDIAMAHKELLDSLLFLGDLAPDLERYLHDFPKMDLSAVQNELHWSTVDFGLNPTVTLTHAAVLTNAVAGNDQHFVVTRQFYSSRYLDASISLTMLLRIPDGDKTHSFIIFTDRSRSDALDGMFGGVARGVVENEAVSRVTELIKNSELRLITEAQKRDQAPTADDLPGETGIVSYLSSRPLIAAAAAAAILAVVLFLLFKRRSVNR